MGNKTDKLAFRILNTEVLVKRKENILLKNYEDECHKLLKRYLPLEAETPPEIFEKIARESIRIKNRFSILLKRSKVEVLEKYGLTKDWNEMQYISVHDDHYIIVIRSKF
ncbi:hypothetical protein K8Q96_00390 [Candidatus Nomurabacteria bacterium]|nr:hypothetical protein [Candidatus Nomurabacteria bacterium]